ncbi:ribbon-helix-helix domain-containing protein [Stappia indica]|uniref:Ribbon-helix-helix domain-containing protein n=1 Tax=Stappia indica TaxID=538381 RepID=A0A285R693_9HYPH|nr:ribbon-helix-helix domain-containing protein [Stappia indica]SOB89288.1 Ribbon-helix-helix domain-containing protein [Stappia indica]
MLAKRSLTLHGHRTSLALEPEFWDVLEEMAEAENVSLPALVARIDDAREMEADGSGDLPSSLSSALRVAALAHCRAKPRTA